MRKKEEVKVFFTDFWPSWDFENNFIMDALRECCNPIIDPRYPDLLFFSCFGLEHYRYNTVKIFFSGENITPDFNVCDYGIGCDFLSFEDRYFRIPYFRLEMGEEAYESYPPEFFAEELKRKKRFCNFIYSNSKIASPKRTEIFGMLSKYKLVDSGGKYLNNISGEVKDKRLWQRRYKFSIAFENSQKNGYTTEKIYDALVAHTIPIYWGNPLISRDFNPKRFISAYNFDNFDSLVEYVKYVDNNDDEYLKIISEPWFINGAPPPLGKDKDLQDFFSSIISGSREEAKRIPNSGFLRSYVHTLYSK